VSAEEAGADVDDLSAPVRLCCSLLIGHLISQVLVHVAFETSSNDEPQGFSGSLPVLFYSGK